MVFAYLNLNQTFLIQAQIKIGYSASSGLPQIIQEADGGCTYEGDNVVLLMQTARYLLKCAQKNVSPHLDPQNFDQLKHSSLFKYFEEYFKIYERLYEK